MVGALGWRLKTGRPKLILPRSGLLEQITGADAKGRAAQFNR